MTDNFAPVSYDVTTGTLQYNDGAGFITIPIGTPGAPGVGVPAGGTTGEPLVKNSPADYDTKWGTPATGYNTFCNPMDFGAVGDGSTDDTAAVNAAITAAMSANHKNVWIPAQTFKCNSALNPLHSAVHFRGVDKSYSVLMRAFNGNFLTFDGSAGFNGGVEDICLVAAEGTSTGTALTIAPTNALTSPDYGRYKNIVITGWGATTGTWWYSLQANGVARVSPNPVGLRDITMENITLFCATAAAATFDGMVAAVIENLQTYPGPAGCTAQVYVGYNSSSNHCYEVLMPNCNITGALSVQNVDAGFYASGVFNGVTITNTVAKASMRGINNGSLSNSAPISSINLI